MTKILKLSDVEALSGLRRSSIYAFMKRGEFPKPIPLGVRAVGWLESEILEWVESRTAMRNLS